MLHDEAVRRRDEAVGDRGAGADMGYRRIALGAGLGEFGCAWGVQLAVADSDEDVVAIWRKGSLDGFEGDDGQAVHRVGRQIVRIHRKPDHPVIALMGQVEVDDLGDLADAENDHVAHGVQPPAVAASGLR